jgi:hypothetical protein
LGQVTASVSAAVLAVVRICSRARRWLSLARTGNGVEWHPLHLGDLIAASADHSPDAIGEPARTVPRLGIVRRAGYGFQRSRRVGIALDVALIVPGRVRIMPGVVSVPRFGERREARDACHYHRYAEQEPHRTLRSTEHGTLIATRGAKPQGFRGRAAGALRCLVNWPSSQPVVRAASAAHSLRGPNTGAGTVIHPHAPNSAAGIA